MRIRNYLVHSIGCSISHSSIDKPVGDAIDNARRGERLVVTLQVQNFDTLYDVVVKDPVAGGLEAMDP